MIVSATNKKRPPRRENNMMPINAEARGKVRAWKRRAETQRLRIERALYETATVKAAVADFVLKSGTGQHRALSKIVAALPGATLESCRHAGGPPLAVWSYLKPRVSVAIDPPDPSDAQGCVTVDYIVAGCLPGLTAGVADGLWSLEVTDHALGRLLQRAPNADLSAVLTAAHHAALRVQIMEVGQGHPEFLLPAGDGCFACTLMACEEEVTRNEPQAHIRAGTWLHRDQLHDDQRPIAIDGPPGHRLGESFLLPAPLRSTSIGEDGLMHVATWMWAPGLSETLAEPQGRA
jgi:hypothetical protein